MTTTPRHLTPNPAALHKASDGTVRAVLTWPGADREGDEVNPVGGDWSQYHRNPVVNWWHTIPIGRGSVRLHKANVHGDVQILPFGTTTFFKSAADLRGLNLKGHGPSDCLTAAAQAAELVRTDVATGVSLEFLPTVFKAIGPNKLDKRPNARPALEVDRWVGLGWAHCPGGSQINAGAQTILEKALRDNRLAGCPLLPVIHKAIAPLVPNRPASVRVPNHPPAARNKAMDEENMIPDDPALTAEPPVEDAPGNDGPTPAVDALMTLAQGLKDLVTAFQDRMGQSEHAKARKKIAPDFVERLNEMADEASEYADDVQAELADEPVAESDAPDVDDPEPLETDDDGSVVSKAVLKKAFPNYKPARVVRLKSSDLEPAKEQPIPKRLRRDIERLTRRLSRYES